MSITLGDYTFDGPYKSSDSLENKAGVYAIFCHKDGEYNLIDIGETVIMKSRVKNHERKGYWDQNCSGTLTVAAYYTPEMDQASRMRIVKEIRSEYNPPHGTK